MIKLNITLGNSFWCRFYLSYSDEFGEILPKIKKHKIVLSKSIIDYYEDNAKTIGCLDICKTKISYLMQSSDNCFLTTTYGYDDIKDELIATARNQEMKILLAEKEEIKKAPKDVNLLNSKMINSKPNCVFNLYTIPVINRYISPRQSVDSYKKWLKNWLRNETTIIIRDRYILENDGFRCFTRHFLPLFEKGSTIILHTDKVVSDEIMNKLDDSVFDDYLIKVYRCERMHERVIILNDFEIVIGKGVSFLSGDRDCTSESFISISEVTIDADKTVIEQLR